MVNKIDLLSDGEFIELIGNSSSISEVLVKLGYSTNGNSWGYRIIKERMEKLQITFGKKYRQIPYKTSKMELEEILKKDSSYNRNKLRRRLIGEGLKEAKCEKCQLTEWLGNPIPLQLHHINGDGTDNRIENLQMLCPNCHTLTENFGTKGKDIRRVQKCESLPLEDKKAIMATVREFGIVEARKRLKYRNSLINSVVRAYNDIIVMTSPSGDVKEFTNTYEVSKYLFNECNIGVNELCNRTGVSKCINGKQTDLRGFKFERKSLI